MSTNNTSLLGIRIRVLIERQLSEWQELQSQFITEQAAQPVLAYCQTHIDRLKASAVNLAGKGKENPLL